MINKMEGDVLFLHIPKNAGTSIRKSVPIPFCKVAEEMPESGNLSICHLSYKELVDNNFLGDNYKNAYKFAIVGNPYRRAVSLFTWMKIITPGIPADTSFLNFTRILKKGIDPIGLYNVKNLSMCNPQVRWIEGIDMDYIMDMEHLEEDYDFLHIEKGPLMHENRKRPLNDKWQDYFCLESKANVDYFYREDFEKFEYEHDIN